MEKCNQPEPTKAEIMHSFKICKKIIKKIFKNASRKFRSKLVKKILLAKITLKTMKQNFVLQKQCQELFSAVNNQHFCHL